MVERWTQERRRQHTRDLLLDAAEQLFATKGFEGAALDEIADSAGYTRGAIYKHFGSKEELFLTVNKRFNERFLTGFLDLIDPSTPHEEIDLDAIAKRWHDLQTRDPHAIALGMEFSLYMLRNPDVRHRVAEHQRALAHTIAEFMEEQASRLGVTLRIPALTLARIALAAGDGLELASHLHDTEDDLYEPFLELLLSAWDTPPARTTRRTADKTAKTRTAARSWRKQP
ncbi:MAG TPA: TetR/AcrR family transcriptional regulator [Jiangellaceae bacterium]|nr:TetR/AcrR family transcriptional regulator [Jiangellaceae bacterium]